MAETKLASIKNDGMKAAHLGSAQAQGAAQAAFSSAGSFPSKPFKTIWDIASDDIAATVLAELRI